MKVALIGKVAEHEKRSEYIEGLLQRSAPAARRAARTQLRESPGRPVGKVEGSWVTDLAELRQHVLLCWSCEHKFKPIHRRYGYFRDTRWKRLTGGVYGRCDGCREPHRGLLQLYLHESYIGQSYLPL